VKRPEASIIDTPRDASHPLEDRNSLFEEMEQIAKIGAWSFDPATGAGQWTKEVARIHGVASFDESSVAFGMTLFAPPSRQLLQQKLAGAVERGEPYDIELELTSGTGKGKWVRAIARPVVENGKVVLVRGTLQDISDRKAVELELAAERARLQTLLDTIPDLVVFKDLEGRFLAGNARLESLFGATKSEILGKTDHDFVPKELADFFRERDRLTLERGVPTRNEEWVTFADDGHKELLEMIKAPVHGPGGAVVGVLGIGRDITAAREAAEALRAAQKMEAVGRLAGGLAHDFNNLLSVILSSADLAAEALPSDHPVQQDLAETVGAARRGEGLTRQLLAFSRRQILQPEPLALGAVVDHLANMLRRLIGEDIDLRIDTVPALHSVKVDRGQIEQVVMNLVVNARDAMPDGGVVVISTLNVELDRQRSTILGLAPGSYVELAVRDGGCGMDEAVVRRVFEPFFTTKPPGKGTGLGLAMAYGIVKQSGGAIDIASEPGAGTVVRIYLPRHEGAARTSATPPGVRRSPGHEKVLVVEDEIRLRSVVSRVLNAAGYEVISAANAEEALRIAIQSSSPIDLLFTDVVMPGMSGSELVDRLATSFPSMKVIFTSGYIDEHLERRGIGNHRFLPKPYNPRQLTDMIREVLDAR
jgi:two-component system, cell cycle sensor histidine kinase and response regulator CckA